MMVALNRVSRQLQRMRRTPPGHRVPRHMQWKRRALGLGKVWMMVALKRVSRELQRMRSTLPGHRVRRHMQWKRRTLGLGKVWTVMDLSHWPRPARRRFQFLPLRRLCVRPLGRRIAGRTPQLVTLRSHLSPLLSPEQLLRSRCGCSTVGASKHVLCRSSPSTRMKKLRALGPWSLSSRIAGSRLRAGQGGGSSSGGRCVSRIPRRPIVLEA